MDEYKENLERYLINLYQIENGLSAIIKSKGLRFSINKLTADLGEYYVFSLLSEKADLFDSIEQMDNSNAPFDFKGKLSKNSKLHKFFDEEVLRIEVKTRRDQKGAKYLSSLKPEKFDLLCVVDMAINYTLNKIYLVSQQEALDKLDTKYGRLIFHERMAFMTLEP